MSLLKTAVKSHIPLIAVTTRDTVYVENVIKTILGSSVKLERGVSSDGMAATVSKNSVHYIVLDEKTDINDVATYRSYAKHHASLIIVNPPKMRSGYLNCGELPTPKPLLKETLMSKVPKESIDEVILSLGGCTVKEAVELCMLTMGETGALTPEGVTKTRKSFFTGSQGLTQIDLTQPFYQPMPELAEWVSKKRKLFFASPDPRLMPRGLLLRGTPGTGKTAGAKFISKQWGVPLYRLDIAATKSKWVGESSSNLLQGLSRADAEEPCLLLMDEVEKVFAKGEYSDAGTTTDMLSNVLWWLAEHRTRVLVVMTTNDEKKLPQELYREGRIDKAFTFEGLSMAEAPAFLDGLLKTYKIKDLPVNEIKAHVLEEAYTHDPSGRPSHARLTELVNDAIATILT